jgi:hypothetical protein
MLSINENALELLNENLEKINWNQFSKNPNGIEIVKKNTGKIKLNGTKSTRKKKNNGKKIFLKPILKFLQ